MSLSQDPSKAHDQVSLSPEDEHEIQKCLSYQPEQEEDCDPWPFLTASIGCLFIIFIIALIFHLIFS